MSELSDEFEHAARLDQRRLSEIIAIGERQIGEGNIHTHEEAKQRLQGWLREET